MIIEPDVLTVLTRLRIDGPRVKIVDQLDRDLYVRVNKVLEAAGGKWSRGQKAHLFPDATDALEQAIEMGQITTHQEINFFETPASLVDRMIDAIGVRGDQSVLEPSVGKGAIAVKLLERGVRNMLCIELDPKLAEFTDARFNGADNVFVLRQDFMTTAKTESGFDRVFMNPPFCKRQDAKHIMQAFDHLKPGGKLCAIAGMGVTFRDDNLGRHFRQVVKANNGTITELPAGTFRDSGTMVNTVMITMEAGRG